MKVKKPLHCANDPVQHSLKNLELTIISLTNSLPETLLKFEVFFFLTVFQVLAGEWNT